MSEIIQKIHSLLIKKGLTVSVAESCTGGILSEFLTNAAGSSNYFTAGIVAYSNKAKERFLNIPHRFISQKGAVSKEVAQRLAHSIRVLSRTDLGIGITGIAGPAGGSKNKPIGTVFIAIEGKNGALCKRFSFRGNRQAIRKRSSLEALRLLYGNIQKI